MTEASENIDFADRIAALIREKNELNQQLKQLTALYDGVLAEKERLEEIIAAVPNQYVPDSVRVETQHSLKFKMVTVMYLDIRAVTSITSCENSAEAIDELDKTNPSIKSQSSKKLNFD